MHAHKNGKSLEKESFQYTDIAVNKIIV